MRTVQSGRKKLLNATKDSVDVIIKVLSREIDKDKDLDDDKLKAAVDGRFQAVKSVQGALIYIDESSGGKDFIKDKIKSLINACWTCFDNISESVLPRDVDEDLEDNRMKNAIVAKDVGREACDNILDIIEQMQDMLEKGEITLKKHVYSGKTIESIAKNVT